ncbi:MAG: site-2 protease family protein [Acidilobus sp.]
MRPWRRSWYYTEVGEPYSWIIGIISIVIAMAGLKAFKIHTYVSPQNSIIVGVVVGVVIHEMMHRNVARRYGMRSSYVTNWLGVIITLLTAVLPIKFIAPGYTKVYSYDFSESRRGILYSVAAGPASNIVMSLVTLVVGVILKVFSTLPALAFTSIWLLNFSYINFYIALFNLLPIPPLDGYKVLRLAVSLWLLMFFTSLALFIVTLLLV